MKTFSAKKEAVERRWYVADANGQILGRFASEVATILRGKHKPIYTPHVDTGDHVVVINASGIRVTGNNKPVQKTYTRYSGYPSGLKRQTLSMLLEKRPELVIQHAIKGMLPKNRLGRKMIKKVRIYAGPDHPHQAQNPDPIDIGSGQLRGEDRE